MRKKCTLYTIHTTPRRYIFVIAIIYLGMYDSTLCLAWRYIAFSLYPLCAMGKPKIRRPVCCVMVVVVCIMLRETIAAHPVWPKLLIVNTACIGYTYAAYTIYLLHAHTPFL